MAKIKVSADAVLAILQGIMNDPAINYTIEDISAPSDWQGKKVQDALGVEYYTFRHRPVDTEAVVEELIKQGKEYDTLEALKRSFCILSLNSTDRVFSKKNDIVTISVNLEYWVQSDKVKLLEDMFEDMAIETTGERIAVQIGKENRQALVAIGALNIAELQEATEYGEMSVCDIDIEIVFYPNATNLSDYTIEFIVDNKWIEVPISSLSMGCSMNQKAVPNANSVRSVGSINLSRVKTFVMAFDGYHNEFVDYLMELALSDDVTKNKDFDNNTAIGLRLTREGKQFFYDCIIKEHSIMVQEDTGNEVHSLTLTRRGIKDGSSQS